MLPMMDSTPIRTSVVGSYPFPGWLEFSSSHLDRFGAVDIQEMQEDAVVAAIQDQIRAGLDVITDGEQSRFDFNLSFYGYLEGISLEGKSPRLWGPPAHDQRGKHEIIGELKASRGLGAVEEFQRLKRLAPQGVSLKASLPGPFTLSGRLLPNENYPDRYAITEALLPIVQKEMVALVEAGCQEICLDEPSMSCYGHREDPRKFVDIFNRTVEPVVGKTRLASHLCFGNFKGRAVGSRRAKYLFPHFLDLKIDEMHIEMATTLWQELPIIETVAKRMDVAIGIIDVKSYHIESPEDVASVIRQALEFAPANRLVVAPDCGLSQTARWAARKKLEAMVQGAHMVRKNL